LLRGISEKVERVILNALATDAALPPDFCNQDQQAMCKKKLRLWRLFCRIALRTSRSTLVATATLQLRLRGSMRIIQTVVQLPASQCIEKCCVVFGLVSNGAPNHLWFHVILREFRNQDVKAVSDSAALIMDDVISPPDRCPDEALPRESWIRDDISCVPILAWFGELSVAAAVTKRKDCG
jgi:hypothetical protein